MTLRITLTANAATKAGVNFNADYAAFFDDLAPYGFPLFNGPSANDTTQIVHLDTPVRGREAQTRAVLLDGDDFQYIFSSHSVSGEIDIVRLVRLGPAYGAATGNLVLRDGVVKTVTPHITIAGFDLQNAAGVKGEVHDVVAGLMGGGPSGTDADPSALTAEIWSQGHDLTGSTGADRYVGSRFADVVRGLAGADVLSGGGGRDTLTGGAGADRLAGGASADTFVFNAVSETVGDVIADFSRSQGDRIRLSTIDAEAGSGNQAFTFIGRSGFSSEAGELRHQVGASTTAVSGDLDGDGVSDFRIALTGQVALGADSFFL